MEKLDELIKDRKELVNAMKKTNYNASEILAEKLYDNPTHFITELLQNAEDEGAHKIEFKLTENELQFSHDAEQLFDFNDIRAISNFGDNKEKKEKPNAIGSFGIGFKSVYSITNTPKIKSGDYDISIEEYIIPNRNKNHSFCKGTEITLPFNHRTRNKKDAFELINKELQDLNLEYLLFLSNVDTIKWTLGAESGIYKRTKKKADKRFPNVYSITLESEKKLKKYLLCEKQIEIDKKKLSIKIAFQLEENKQNKKIKPCEQAPLFVFFPTTKETFLKFLVHAPYLTTPARDNITEMEIEKDHRNEILTQELGKLLAESLTIFKQFNLLNVELLNVLPLNKENCKRSLIYNELYNAVKNELSSGKKLIPTSDETFSSANEAMLVGSADLVELLKKKQTIELFGKSFWTDKGITNADKTKELRDYLFNELKIPEYDLTGFASKIDAKFMAGQSDKWIIQFYKIIHNKGKNLWRDGDNKTSNLRKKEIIRTEDCKQIVPFLSDGKPNVYLPIKENSQYSTVKKNIANDKEASKFLKDLGLTEPDLFAEINEFVIPKFNETGTYPGYFEDIKKIINAFQFPNQEKCNRLIKDLKKKSFILGLNYETGETKLLKYNEVYFKTEHLKIYFSGNESAFFVDEEQNSFEKKAKNQFNLFLKELGVIELPQKIKIDKHHLTEDEKQKLRKNSNLPDKTWDRVTDYDLEGLQLFFEQITKNKSIALWNILISAPDEYFRGNYEWTNYSSYTRTKSFAANFVNDLKTKKWLYDENETLVSPSEITVSQLNKIYDTDNVFATLLGFQLGGIKAMEEETGGKFVPKEKYEKFRKWEIEEEKRNSNEDNDNEDEFKPEFKPNEVAQNSKELEESEITIKFNESQGNDSNKEPFTYTNIENWINKKNGESEDKPSPKLLKEIGNWGEAFVEINLSKEFVNDTSIEIIDLNKQGKKGVGCDFLIKQNGQIIRLIEVKSTIEKYGQPLSISGTQWEIARNCFNENDGDKYWVYCVFNAGQKNSEIIKVKNPIKQWRDGKLFAHPINFIIQ